MKKFQFKSKEKIEKLWNSSFIRILIYAILCQFTMSMSNTVLPLYVINSLGYSNASSGLLGTVFTIASTVCRFAAGGLSDRFGRRIMLISGAAIVGFALIFMGFTASFIVLLFLKGLQGMGHSFNTTAANAAAADVLPRERMGDGLSYYAINSSITNAIGPTIALLLMTVGVASTKSNYMLPLLCTGCGGLVAAVIAFSLNYEKNRMPGKSGGERTRFRISDFLEKRALMPALLQLFQSFATGAAVFMIVFANAMRFNSITYYYLIIAAATLATRLIVGKKMDTIKPVTAVLVPLILAITGYFYLGRTLSETAFIVSGVILGIYGAMMVPTFNALALKLAPANRRGAASATYWLGFDVGMAIGMIAFGAIIDAGGFSASFLTAAGYMALYGIVAFFVLRKQKPIRDIQSPQD